MQHVSARETISRTRWLISSKVPLEYLRLLAMMVLGAGSKDRKSQVSLSLQSDIMLQHCSAQMGLMVLAVVLREITAYSLENSQERTGTASRLGDATYRGLCVSCERILNFLGT